MAETREQYLQRVRDEELRRQQAADATAAFAAFRAELAPSAERLRELVAEIDAEPEVSFGRSRYFSRNPFTQRVKTQAQQQRDYKQLRMADRIRQEFGEDAGQKLHAMQAAGLIPASVPGWFVNAGPDYRRRMVSPYEDVGLLGPGTALSDAMTWMGSTPGMAGDLATGAASAADAATAYATAPRGQRPMYGRPTGWAHSLERNINTLVQPLWSAMGISDEVPSHFSDQAATRRAIDAATPWQDVGRGAAHRQFGHALEQMSRPRASEELLTNSQIPMAVARPLGLVMDTVLDPGAATGKVLKLARMGLPRQAAGVLAGDYALGGLLTGAGTYAEWLQKQQELAGRKYGDLPESDPLYTDGGLNRLLAK